MKICEDGVIREVTAEEIAAMQESSMAAESTIEPLTNEKKMELSIHIPRVGDDLRQSPKHPCQQ